MEPEKIMEYLYGEMPEQEKKRFEESIAKDEELAKEVQDFRAVRLAAAEWKDDVNPVFQPQKHYTQKQISFSIWSFASGIAAAMLISSMLFVFGQKKNEIQEPFSVKAQVPQATPAAIPANETSGKELTSEQLEEISARVHERDMAQLTKLIQRSQVSREKELESALATFARYLDQQRKADIHTISTELDRIRKTSDDKFYETDQALGTLFQSVQLAGK